MRLVATVERRAAANRVLRDAGDAALVRRGRDRLLILRCPCGCGEDVVVNLDPAAGPAWSMYRTRRGASLFPSVWRESGCASHFIVWDDVIHLFPIAWRDSAYPADRDLDERVLRSVRAVGRTSYSRLAERLDEVPWAVLAACRRLVRAALVSEVDDMTFEPV